MNDTDASVSSVASSKENTPRKKKNTVRVCSSCQDHKPRGAFPKRQWDKKNRRCFSCISGSVPFPYHPKKIDHADENIAPNYVETERNLVAAASELVPTNPRKQPLSSIPPSRAVEAVDTVPKEGTVESIVGAIEAENGESGHKEVHTSPVERHASSTGGNGKARAKNRSEPAQNQNDTSTEDNAVAEPAVSLEDDIEDLARNWTPPVQEPSSPTRVPPPASAPPEPPQISDNSSSGRRPWREFLLLFVSPILDESGSFKSVLAGLFTLFLFGSLIGVASHKNSSLPSEWYQYVSATIGYIYFLCWSVSFYPQVISNFKRKSTHGLSADFCALNVVGFGCYTAYNVSLFWSPTIRELYRQKYGAEVTVQSNDVAFAIHALLLSSITLGQVAYYHGSERPSKMIVAVIVLVLTLCAVYPVLVIYDIFSWLDYLYVLSFVKIGISLIKYMPQVVLNHRRKSTVGWSIWNILLDFTGGVLSDLQLVLDCAAMGDFSGITGNLAKFGLGFVSIVFDIVFMVQHYVLYPERRRVRLDPGRPETEPLLSQGEQQGEAGEGIV